MKGKSKYIKRRATECTLVEKSKSNPGYCKYMITIRELDGTVHTQPAYGKDMQGALARLMNKERTVKVERRLENNTGLIFLLWLIVMGTPAVFADTGSPWFLAYVFGSVIMLLCIVVGWYNYVNKGEV